MSPILHTTAIATGGILAGLSLAGALLWWQQQALQTARYEASHDEITGLPNRRLFLARLRAALAERTPVGVVLLDLDRFKAVNDTLGHDTGNVLLEQVGRLLASLPTPVPVAARLSGDEVALLVSGDDDDTAAAAHTAWQVIAAAPLRLDTGEIPVAASVGYTHTHDPHASPPAAARRGRHRHVPGQRLRRWRMRLLPPRHAAAAAQPRPPLPLTGTRRPPPQSPSDTRRPPARSATDGLRRPAGSRQ